MEPMFEIIYLLLGLGVSILILIEAKKNKSFILFGIMGFTLVFGDAFHLIPRIINAWGLEVDNIYAMLGIGKLITSITMTIFYIMLYHFFKIRYRIKAPLYQDIFLYALAIIRIVLCILPQNEWRAQNTPLSWAIYRNIPFTILGGFMVYFTYFYAKEKEDRCFKYTYLLILLSFVFYMMTVLLTDINSLFGLMMLPKTVCYVIILFLGYKASLHQEE